MRGFRIWLQNSNQITFDHLFGKKTVENGQNIIFHPFRQLLAKEGGQMLSDLNFEARFGILIFKSIFRPHLL